MRCTMRWLARMALILGGLTAHAAQAESEPEENLIVFVGEKISVEQFEPVLGPNTIRVDGAFKAKFRIKQMVYGHYDGEIIEFEAYDHYGVPAFAGFAHSLLFVSRHDGKLYHQKYQFYPVFLNRSGVWAGCGPVGESDTKDRRGIAWARPMRFGPEAYLPLGEHWWDYPTPREFSRRDFRLDEDKAYCLTGTPVQDLFEVKKRTVLKARGMFGGKVED